MASKFLRHQNWWIKFRHPFSRTLFRESLETTDEARAELLRQRIGFELSLQEPRLQSLVLPQQIQERLHLRDIVPSSTEPPRTGIHPAPTVLSTGASSASMTVKRMTVDEAVAVYLRFIVSENAVHHVENKVSMLRRFLGSQRVAAAGGPIRSSRGVRPGAKEVPFFRGPIWMKFPQRSSKTSLKALG